MSTDTHDFCRINLSDLEDEISTCNRRIAENSLWRNCGEISVESLNTLQTREIRDISAQSHQGHEYLYISEPSRISKYIIKDSELHLIREWERRAKQLIAVGNELVTTTSSQLLSLPDETNCRSFQTCFQCVAAIFPWSEKCKWEGGECIQGKSLNKYCPSTLQKTGKYFLYRNSEDETMEIEGENFGISSKIDHSCEPSKIISIVTRSHPPRNSILLHLNAVPKSSRNSWECHLIIDEELDPKYGIKVGGRIDIPRIIFHDEPIDWRIAHMTLPRSAGSLVRISATNIFNGAKCFPQLTIDDNVVSYPLNTSRNEVDFLIPGFPEMEEISLFISVDEHIKRHVGRVRLADPGISEISLNTSIHSGGIPVVFRGENLESLQKPALFFNFTNGEQSVITETRATIETPDEIGFLAPEYPFEESSLPQTVEISLKSNSEFQKLICDEGKSTPCGTRTNILPVELSYMEYIRDPIVNKIPTPNALKLNGPDDRKMNVSFTGVPEQFLELGLVEVLVGTRECEIQNFTVDNLTCQLPPYHQILVQQQSVVLRIGTGFEWRVGTFCYEGEEDQFDLRVAVGATVAFLGVVLFVSAVLVCSWFTQHRSRKGRRVSANGQLHYNPHFLELTEQDVVALEDTEDRVLSDCFTEEEEREKYVRYYSHNRVKPQMILTEGAKTLGEGAFGKVYRMRMECTWDGETTSLEIAVKFSKQQSAEKLTETWRELLDEGHSMRDFSHKNILGMLGFSILTQPMDDPTEQSLQPPSLCIILPYMTDGDLKSYLGRHKATLTNRQRLTFSLHAARGMDYLQKQKMIHGDLAARNCMLTRMITGSGEELVLKVADFGLTRDGQQAANQVLANKPVCWCSPELLRTSRPSFQSDVWAFGVLMWEIFTSGAQPFRHLFAHGQPMDLMRVQNAIIKENETPAVDPKIIEMESVREIMKLCWSYMPMDRPQFSEIIYQLEDVLRIPHETNTGDSFEEQGGRLTENPLANYENNESSL